MDNLEKLYSYIKSLGKVAVAFSGGVDSTFLLKACVNAVGAENVVAITALASASPSREISCASKYANAFGVKHIAFDFDQMQVEGFCQNPADRCYFCKKALFIKMIELAKENGFIHILEGSNLDDNLDYRPGHRAIDELGIKSPLRQAEFCKADIRKCCKQMGLEVWSKPALACLATRFVYGEPITLEKLKMVDEAENFLNSLGFVQVRVRVHQNIARIEILQNELEKLLPFAKQINEKLSAIGFDYVTVDLAGYSQGSMNINI